MQRTTLPWTLDPLVVAGADATSEALSLGDRHIFAIHAIWPTGLVGGIGIEASIDGAVWEIITDSEQAVTDAGSFMWNYTAAGFNYARPYFDWTSGSGTIVIKASDKRSG